MNKFIYDSYMIFVKIGDEIEDFIEVKLEMIKFFEGSSKGSSGSSFGDKGNGSNNGGNNGGGE